MCKTPKPPKQQPLPPPRAMARAPQRIRSGTPASMSQTAGATRATIVNQRGKAGTPRIGSAKTAVLGADDLQ